MTPPTTRAAILELLERDGPMHVSAIAAALGKDPRSIGSAIRCARRQPDVLHIAGWKRSMGTSGRWGAIWAAGPGKDARQPVPLSARECNARYQKRWAAVRRVKLQARRGKPIPSWIAGLV